MKKLLASRLCPGDTIGIFSPSTPATAWIPERTELAVRLVEKQGFRVKMGRLAGKQQHYRSGSIRERADELNELIRDPQVSCIMASGGGYVSGSILPYIDYGAIRENPKVFVGFSDVTAILLGIYAQTGLITFYGPNLITNFGEVLPYSQQTFEWFEDMVCGCRNAPYALEIPECWTEDSVGQEERDVQPEAHKNEWICVREGSVQGRLMGGNLNTITSLMGTPYMPEIREGDILFLEDNRGTPETIEHSFAQLENAGIFEKTGGLILGKQADYRQAGTGLSSWEVPLEIIGKYSFPILAQFDCGHTRPMHTLPLGGKVLLDAGMRKAEILDQTTK